MTGDDRGTLARIATHLAGALQPLEDGFRDPEAFRGLLFQLGWEVRGLPPSYVAVADKAVRAGEALRALADDAGVEQALAVISAAGDVYRAVMALDEAPTGVDPDAFLPELARRLLELLLGRRLLAEEPHWFAALQALGVIALEDTPETDRRPGFTRLRFDWDRIPALLRDPGLIPAAVYGWGTPELRFARLAEHIGQLLIAVGLPTSLDRLPRGLTAALQASATPPARPANRALTAVLFDVPLGGTYAEVGLRLAELPADGAAPPGVVLVPLVPDGLTEQVDLGDGWAFALRAGTDLAQQLAVAVRPGIVEARYPFAAGQQLPSAGFGASLVYGTGQPMRLFGQPDGTRLELSTATLSLAVETHAGDVELRVGVGVTGLALVLSPGGADGFLHALLGGGERRVELQFAVGWSSRTGLDVVTGGGLAVSVLPHLDLGPVRVDQAELALHAAAGGAVAALEARATVALSGELGPVAWTLDRLGVGLPVTFADGNAGPFDVRLTPLWPTGVGLSIDLGAGAGGGFLSYDEQRGEYAGALELQLGKIGVKAIGVLSTGPGDWSLVLLLYAQVPPIQLGFGFTLEGIGGLVGVQRAVDLPQLITGMKSGAFDDILFPADPVRDAPRILGRLRTLFPARARSLTVGPMIDVHWGKPLILTARLAVLLELDNALGSTGGPLALARVVLVGQLRVAVGPTEEDPDARIVLLIVDVLGFWDLADKRYGFIAALRDSTVAGIAITGGLGVWGEYGANGRFLLAAGGFNPRFQDIPAQLSGVLDRLGGAFSVGRFDLALAGYFALTPATIQAGLDLRASATIGAVGLTGDIGFDALVYRRPRTHFIADFHVVVEVTYHGHALAGVRVNGTIEGPSHWHIVGQATFSILWWDISAPFDESWGAEAPLLVDQVDVGALLGAALALRENWSTQLPSGNDAVVTLAPRRGDLAPRAHPLGRFAFSQQVAPLGLSLDKFGDSAVAGPNRFDVESVTIGGRPVATVPVREHFARAQFLETAEEDRLTRPSFEEMDAGAEFSSAAFEVGAPQRVDMEYETAYLDLETRQTRPESRRGVRQGALDDGLVQGFGRYGAAGRAPQRATERMAAVRLGVAVSAPPVAAADRRTLLEVALDGPTTTAQMLVEQRIRRAGVVGAQLVEAFELAGA